MQRKCEQYKYLHDHLGEPYNAGRGLTVVTTGFSNFADHLVREVTVSSVSPCIKIFCNHMDMKNSCMHSHSFQPSAEPLYVKHFQYTGWPDHGVPFQPSSVVRFIQQVRKEFVGKDTSIVVHCRCESGMI